MTAANDSDTPRHKIWTIPYAKDVMAESGHEVGEFTYASPPPRVWDWEGGGKLRIGKFCSISAEVDIFLGGAHHIEWVTTYPFSALADWPEAHYQAGYPVPSEGVVIGNDVWIGHGATILSDVTVGDGAVIGACAVVAKDVEPYAIVVGNPAKQVRSRFDDATVERLLRIRWWDWPLETIHRYAGLMCSEQIEEFLAVAESLTPEERGRT